MRASPNEQRLAAWEEEFAPLLIKRLKEYANEPRGLFGQNRHPQGENLPVEPKRADKFLNLLGIDW